LELERDNLRQYVAVTSEIEGADLGSVIDDIKAKLATGPQFPPAPSNSAASISNNRRNSIISWSS